MTLPVRIVPFPGEALPSLVVRACRANGIARPHDLAETAKVHLAGPSPYEGLCALSYLLRLSGIARRRLSPVVLPDGLVRFGAEVVYRTDITRPRYCPRCLAERHFVPVAWMHRAYQVCVIHQIELYRAPPAFSGPLLEPSPLHAKILAPQVKFALRLHALIARAAEGRPIRTALVDDLPLRDATRLAGKLGRAMCGSTLDDVTAAQVEAGAAALLDGQDGVDRVLNAVVAGAQQRKGRFGYLKSFGSLAVLLKALHAQHQCPTLVDQFRAFVEQHPTLRLDCRRAGLIHDTDDRNAALTLREALQELGLSRTSGLRVLGQAGPLPRSGSGAPIPVAGALVRLLQLRVRDTLSFRETAQYLAISRKRLEQLVQADLVRPTWRPGECHARRWMFAPADLDAFVQPFRRLIRDPRILEPSGDLRPFNVAIPRPYFSQLSFAEIVAALLEQRLAIHGMLPQAPCFRALLLSCTEVRAFFADTASAKATLSVPMAARALGLNDETAYQLVRAGLLPTESAGDDERGLRVRRTQVDLFKTTYVTCTEAARRMKTSRRSAVTILIEQGALPITTESGEALRLHLFRRCEAEWILRYVEMRRGR